jgi:hypothetical protein
MFVLVCTVCPSYYNSSQQIYVEFVPERHETLFPLDDLFLGAVHCKKGYRFSRPKPLMSPTKLSLPGNNLIIPGQGFYSVFTSNSA